MKKICLLLMLTAVFQVAAADAPKNYMELKAQFKDMPVRIQKAQFIKKHVLVGVASGAVMFAMNEYFIRTENEAFHSAMPYVAIAYAIFQGYSIWQGSNYGPTGVSCGSGAGVTILKF